MPRLSPYRVQRRGVQHPLGPAFQFGERGGLQPLFGPVWQLAKAAGQLPPQEARGFLLTTSLFASLFPALFPSLFAQALAFSVNILVELGLFEIDIGDAEHGLYLLAGTPR